MYNYIILYNHYKTIDIIKPLSLSLSLFVHTGILKMIILYF